MALILRPVRDRLRAPLQLRRLSAVILLYGLFVLAVAGVLSPSRRRSSPRSSTLSPTCRPCGRTHWHGRAAFPRVARLHPPSPGKPGRQSASAPSTQQAQTGRLLRPCWCGPAPLARGLWLRRWSRSSGLTFFFFLPFRQRRPHRRLSEHLTFLKDEHRDDVVFLIREFLGIVVAFFRGQLLIGCIMGVLLAIGFSLAGSSSASPRLDRRLINIVPYLGSILGLSVVLPLALLQPDGGGIRLLGICWRFSWPCRRSRAGCSPRASWASRPASTRSRSFSPCSSGARPLAALLGMLLAVPSPPVS